MEVVTMRVQIETFRDEGLSLPYWIMISATYVLPSCPVDFSTLIGSRPHIRLGTMILAGDYLFVLVVTSWLRQKGKPLRTLA